MQRSTETLCFLEIPGKPAPGPSAGRQSTRGRGSGKGIPCCQANSWAGGGQECCACSLSFLPHPGGSPVGGRLPLPGPGTEPSAGDRPGRKPGRSQGGKQGAELQSWAHLLAVTKRADCSAHPAAQLPAFPPRPPTCLRYPGLSPTPPVSLWFLTLCRPTLWCSPGWDNRPCFTRWGN